MSENNSMEQTRMSSINNLEKDDLDSQIQKTYRNAKKCYYAQIFLLIIFIPLFGLIINIFDSYYACIVVSWIVVFPFLLWFFHSQMTKWGKEYVSLRADKINVRFALSKYCALEDYDPNEKVDKKLLKSLGFETGFYMSLRGRNYLKGAVDNYSFETSYISLYYLGTKYQKPSPLFVGQIAFLESPYIFYGILLVTRAYKDGGFGRLSKSRYQSQILDMICQSREGYKSSFTCRLEDVFVPISDDFDKEWWVYSTKPEAAKKLLGVGTEMHKLLLNDPRLLFLLYDNDRIVFGGKYGYDLFKGSIEEASDAFIDAVDLFFNEAFPIATKPFS